MPLEAIIAHSTEGLATVRTFLDLRQQDVAKSGAYSYRGGGLTSPRGSAPRQP